MRGNSWKQELGTHHESVTDSDDEQVVDLSEDGRPDPDDGEEGIRTAVGEREPETFQEEIEVDPKVYVGGDEADPTCGHKIDGGSTVAQGKPSYKEDEINAWRKVSARRDGENDEPVTVEQTIQPEGDKECQILREPTHAELADRLRRGRGSNERAD